MSKPSTPSPEQRRQAALSGTPVAKPRAATVFVLRLGDNACVWLKREVPSVNWGTKQQAMTFKTVGEARRAISRLSSHGTLAIEALTVEAEA